MRLEFIVINYEATEFSYQFIVQIMIPVFMALPQAVQVFVGQTDN